MRSMSLCFSPSNGRSKECRQRDEAITEAANKDFEGQKKVIQLLLLGTGESGKSTICKQMQIIHINGFSVEERREKLAYMRRNIRDSIACIVAAMEKLGIQFECQETAEMGAWLLREMAGNQVHNSTRADLDPFVYSDRFFETVERLWKDPGVQESFRNSSRYQLIDCAKYFLDRVHWFRNPSYLPTDQDILRCRIMTNNITDIRFDIKDGNHTAKFRVYDVGGQKGERKKWIQCFNNVTAILYLCDVSSFDLTLKEDVGCDRPKNRLLESLDTFQEVWLNRYLQDVSVLLFINKIDQLDEKIRTGKSIHAMLSYCQQTLELEATAVAATAAAAADGDTASGPDDGGFQFQRRRSCRASAAAAASTAGQGATAPATAATPASAAAGGAAATATATATTAAAASAASAAAAEKSKKKNVGPLDLVRFISQLDFERFQPSEEERREFLDTFPKLEDFASAAAAAAAVAATATPPPNGSSHASASSLLGQRGPQQPQKPLAPAASSPASPPPQAEAKASRAKKKKQQQELTPSVHQDTIKTACFVKNIFLEIAKRKRQADFKFEYHHHTCCYYYTCAVNTDNVKKVLEGCRAFIIDKHLERFGIL